LSVGEWGLIREMTRSRPWYQVDYCHTSANRYLNHMVMRSNPIAAVNSTLSVNSPDKCHITRQPSINAPFPAIFDDIPRVDKRLRLAVLSSLIQMSV